MLHLVSSRQDPRFMSPFHLITGQFRDAGTEREFRAFALPDVQRDSFVTLLVASVLSGLFIVSDYAFLGDAWPFQALVGIRSVMVAACLGLALFLRSSDALLTRPWLYSLMPLVIAVLVVVVVVLRPQTLPTQMTAVAVVILAFYLFVPNLVSGMLVSSFVLTTGFMFGIWYWANASASTLIPFGVLAILTNSVGYAGARRLARMRRQQFALLREEQRSKQRLMEEIAHRETLEQRLRDLAQTDDLTGLNNRRHFVERATIALDQARQADEPYCLCMIDIDNFKAINDRWGHASGDRVLCAVAEACVATFRRGDPISRFGGEEFVAALPGAGLAEARTIAERLRAQVAKLEIGEQSPDLRVTVTIGLAEAGSEDSGLDPLIERADAALYEGKRSGRNVVVVG